jgi:flagellar basal-body rod protein FlgG
MSFNNNDLRKEGENLYMNFNSQNNGVESRSSIAQGFLEGSNVDLAKTMVNMIEIYRNYESNQKMVKMQDETLGKAVTEIGKI